jgi:hypothetical protein
VDDDTADQIVATAVGVYDDAEQAIIRAITRRLARGLDAGDWHKRKLSEIGALRTDLRRILDVLNRAGPSAVRDAIAHGWRAGNTDAVQDLAGVARIPQGRAPHALRALTDAVVGELRPLHSQVLPGAESAYRRAVAAAAGRQAVGVANTRRAAQAAWAALVDDGISGFTDTSGRRWRLHTYVEMATRTAVARAADIGVIDACMRAENPHVYVTDRPQECKVCRPWEHKILSITAPAHRPAIGTVGEARRKGLGHPNCRHTLKAYTPGTRLTPGRADPAGDAARQRQRALERNLRRWREREAAALDDDGRRRAQAHITAWDSELRAHLAASAGLRRMRHREHPGAGYTPPPTRRADTARI